jgi:hypothetical protein
LSLYYARISNKRGPKETKTHKDIGLYRIRRKKGLSKLFAIILNSTLTVLYLELFARQPGGGGGPLDIDVNVAADLFVPTLSYIKKIKPRIIRLSLLSRTIADIFSELGAFSSEDVTLDKVKLDRRELDNIIMGDILGLTEEEQLEVYRAVIDLVKSRIEKAKSVNKNKRTKNGINLSALKNSVIEHIKREA